MTQTRTELVIGLSHQNLMDAEQWPPSNQIAPIGNDLEMPEAGVAAANCRSNSSGDRWPSDDGSLSAPWTSSINRGSRVATFSNVP